MRTVLLRGVAVLYGVAMIMSTEITGPRWSVWLLTAMAALLGAGYAYLSRGSGNFAVFVAFAATFAFPVIVLTAVGLPIYGSLSAVTQAFWSSVWNELPLRGLEFILPTGAAVVASAVTLRARSATIDA